MKLSKLEPKKVFEYFEQICEIPHGSYNTDKTADYIVKFAREHQLEYSRDSHNNIVIKKQASHGHNSGNTVIIQGHLDMVCAKDTDVVIDFENQGLDINCNEKYVFANGTTLGGDDGIAVAMALAVLDSNSISHPNLECVFTTDEEVGMLGANAMDMSELKGRYMLNIDSENEGEFTVSCAGGETLVTEFSIENSNKTYSNSVNIAINGLLGGHSGVEIDKGRANAIILMGEILSEVKNAADIELVEIKGGQKDNAIAFECYADINTNDVNTVLKAIDICKEKICSRYSNVEKTMNISANVNCAKPSTKYNIIDFLSNVTNGVKSMSKEIPGLVQTSSNLGVIRKDKDKTVAIFSIRSSVETEKDNLHNEIKELAQFYGAKTYSFGKYPAWEFRNNSELQRLCKQIYKKQYNSEAKISAIHAGLECGIFSSKIKNLDCISFGPDILNIHTSDEKLDISSVQRVYAFLIELLSQI